MLSRLLLPLFWLTLVAVYALAILPVADVPRLANDKVEHMMAFFTLAVLASLALPRIPVVRIAVGLVAFGGLIELSQMMPAIHRDGSVFDWLADGAAIAGGLIMTYRIRRPAEDAR